MAKIKEWTINDFYDKVCSWYDNQGNGALVNKALPNNEGDRGAVYTVLWSILALADKEKMRDPFSKKLEDQGIKVAKEKGAIVRLVRDGCKLQPTNKKEDNDPNFPRQFFRSQNIDDLYKHFNEEKKGYKDKLGICKTGDMKIHEVRDPIIKYIGFRRDEDTKNEISRDAENRFRNAFDTMFNTDEEEIKMSENNERKYEEYKGQIVDAIKNRAKQIILTGAPGTGKTRMAKEIAEEEGMGTPLPWKEKNEEGKEAKYELVQFHPSYDYTDFVEGLRPVEVEVEYSENNKKVEVEFKKLDGIFKHFCRLVAERNKAVGKVDNNPEKYFFLIDEINRADLSKVFGELMYCLESDKRGAKNRIQTQYQNLSTYRCENDNGQKQEPELIYKDKDVFANGFYIPENVCIIGTMNDIDRSVESMDYALRRRFLWMEIEVNENLLKGAFENKDFWEGLKGKDPEKRAAQEAKIEILTKTDKAEELAKRVMALNNIIAPEDKNKTSDYSDFGLNKQYYISQGQFANLPSNALEDGDTKKDVLSVLLEYVWKWRIKPLLKEYVRGEDESRVKAFIEACKNALFSNPVQPKEPEKKTQPGGAVS